MKIGNPGMITELLNLKKSKRRFECKWVLKNFQNQTNLTHVGCTLIHLLHNEYVLTHNCSRVQ